MSLTEGDLQKISEIIERVASPHCSSKVCEEKCGVTPVQHAEAHHFLRDFIKTFEAVKNRSLNVITGFIILGILSLIGWGGLAMLTTKIK